MASSGSVDSGGYQGRVLRFSWWTNSTSGNTRNIGYQVQAVGGSSSTYYHHSETVDLNGTRIYTGAESHAVKTNDVLASGTMNIDQNNTSTLSVSMHGGIYSRTDNINKDYSWTLDTLVVAPTINSLSLKSRTSTSLTFSFSCSKADNWYYKLSSAGSYTTGPTGGVTSGEFTISGLNPNTKYTVNFIARNWAGSTAKDSSRNADGTTFAKTTPTISLSSKTVNSITVTSGCNVSVSSTQYRIKTSSGSYGAYQNSATFSGLTPNTAYTIEVRKVGSDSGEAGTATINVTTYQIATISSAPNINFGDTAKVTKANPSGATNKLRLETLNPTTTIATRDNVANDYTLTLSDSEWDTLYKKLGNSNSITIRYVVDTIQNGVTYYNSTDRTLTLTGNQKTGHINISDSYKRTKRWININGTWKRCVRWININGTWHRCI